FFSCTFHCFFFQAEDGIRGFHVTGVQTCGLPICQSFSSLLSVFSRRVNKLLSPLFWAINFSISGLGLQISKFSSSASCKGFSCRSEERRVGKEYKGWMSMQHSETLKNTAVCACTI